MKKSFSKLSFLTIFFITLFIGLISFNNTSYAEFNELGSINNPNSLKINGNVYKYTFKKNLSGKVINYQVGLMLKDIKSGDSAEKLAKQFVPTLDKISTKTSTLYIFQFTLFFYSSTNKTSIKPSELIGKDCFYNINGIPLSTRELNLVNNAYDNNFNNSLSPGTSSLPKTVTFYYAISLSNFAPNNYPIIELKNIDKLKYTSFVSTDPKYIPNTLTNLTDISSQTDIAKTTISGLRNKINNGKPHSQELIIKYGDTLLKRNIDYKIYYTNNINVGESVVYIFGIGKYYGHRKLYYFITPPAPKSVVATNQTTNKLTLTWSYVTSTYGYRIYMYNPIKKTWVLKDQTYNYMVNSKVITTDYYNRPLKAASRYIIRVVPFMNYKSTSSNKCVQTQGAYKQATVYTRPNTTSIKSITSPSKGKIAVSWNKCSNVSGYEMLICKDMYGKQIIKKVSAKNTCTKISNLKSNTNYWIIIRSYITSNNKKLYSKNSTGRCISVK